jgi:hypothetical protein
VVEIVFPLIASTLLPNTVPLGSNHKNLSEEDKRNQVKGSGRPHEQGSGALWKPCWTLIFIVWGSHRAGIDKAEMAPYARRQMLSVSISYFFC